MKVKDWLSVVNLEDSGGCISTIEFYNDRWVYIQSFDSVEDAIEKYGEKRINYVSFETLVFDDDISINIKLEDSI
jgi:hypothetical protein